MELLLFVLILSSIFFLIKRYLNFLVSLFLSRYLRCESVRLQGCTLFSIKNAKFVFKNGISIEIENLHLGSSFISQENSKPISFFADDIRIESQSALDLFHRRTDDTGKAKDVSYNIGNEDTRTRRIRKILQFIQYANARFNCVNIVLLEAIPDCLLHISFENLQVETYRDREGLQLEVSYKLTQTKLFVRNFQRSICLAQISLAGLFSIEVSEKKCYIRKLSLILNNPRFSIFDGMEEAIFEKCL